jgi:hypothetical protein
VPWLPEPADLRTERAATAQRADELHPWRARSRVRALLDRWLAHRVGSRRRRIAKAKTAAPTPADLWNAWAVADLECALALRAWQLAPRCEKRAPYRAYRDALEREALVARELRLRAAS